MSLARHIRDELGIETSDRAPDRITYSRDLWPRHHIAVRDGRIAEHRPRAIAWPESTEQVQRLVALCVAEGVRVVPFGAGSGVCGAVLPDPETLVIDVKRMNRWRQFAPDEGFLEVEAGALGIRLEEDLQARGATVGHFPSSILCSTVGGWVAARGAGQCSGLYGKIEDMTAAIEHVDGHAEVATLRRRRTGPDMTPIITGAEGILGIITSVRLRLHAVAEKRAYAAYSFRSMEAGYEAIRSIYQAGLRPAVCRLYDPFDSMMARRGARKKSKGEGRDSSKLGWLSSVLTRNALRMPGAINQAIDGLGTRAFGGAMLVLVFEGAPERVADEAARARPLCAALGAEELGEGPARHWLDKRYAVSYRQAPMFMMGAFVDTMEVAAPWSRLGALYDGVREALGEHVMVMAHMSHAYPDGCSIYFTFAGSAKTERDAETIYDRAWRDAAQAAIRTGGTLSHHHGVGRSKAPHMGDELGLGVEVVRALRGALDPKGIFNPGNLIPEDSPPRRPLPEAPATPELDERSQTVHVAGSARLASVEDLLRPHGLSLGLEDVPDTEVGSWLEAGGPGAPDPWLDPADHLVAGYSAELAGGGALHIRPCPRRAVGPDLWALFQGTAGRAGRIHTVHLRARGQACHSLDTSLEREPAIDESERRVIDRCLDAVKQLP
jgi:alkyldihydroxyacetonephosphate synthase